MSWTITDSIHACCNQLAMYPVKIDLMRNCQGYEGNYFRLEKYPINNHIKNNNIIYSDTI